MNNKLENLRKQIDIIDKKIITLLGKRMLLAKKTGKLKKEQGLPFIDKKRWDKVIVSALSKAESLGLSKTFIKALYSLIHKYSIKTQKEAI